jgi:hypothetical protein
VPIGEIQGMLYHKGHQGIFTAERAEVAELNRLFFSASSASSAVRFLGLVAAKAALCPLWQIPFFKVPHLDLVLGALDPCRYKGCGVR